MAPGGLIRPHQPLLSTLHQMLEVMLVPLALYLSALLHDVKWREEYYLAAFAVAAGFYLFARQQGLYESWRSRRLDVEVRHLLTAWGLMLLLCLLLAYATKTSSWFSRRVVVTWMLFTPLLLIGLRALLRSLLHQMRRWGRNSRAIAIAGSGQLARTLISTVEANPWMGMRVAGLYCDEQPPDTALEGLPQYRVRGSLAALQQDVRHGEFDEVYVALPMQAEDTLQALVSDLGNASVPVHVVPDLFTSHLLNARLRDIGGLPVISVYDRPLEAHDEALKRAEDLVLSSLILLVAALPMLLIALLIKLDSRGPVFFRQRRYGLSGEEIRIWKFRTMTVIEDGDRVPQARRDDRRITRVGRWLRRTSLDELPQFFNVLSGSMSVVGPRPHAVAHNEAYRQQIDGYMLRHLVKPGITGWAQVHGWRGETDTLDKMQKRIQYDLEYIQHWSLWLDLKIILMTPFCGLLHRNAY